MELLGQIYSGFMALAGCFGFVPMILAVAALVDSIRVGAGWYWCMIILAFPVIGPIAYFVVVRSPMLGARNAALMSPGVARRLQARKRLKALQVQLVNWRGPGILAEAGEELLVLGKHREAEKHFREAQENGAAVEDVNYGLAQALQMQGRFADSVPLLQKLCEIEPDSHLGEGPLALARALDESGQRDEAEPVLRRVLERRSKIEAQVRLARILLHKGEKEEARQLLTEIKTESAALPRYLKRRYRKWIWAARGMRSGTSGMPKPQVEGAFPTGYRLRLGLAAAAVFVLLVVGGGYAVSRLGSGVRAAAQVAEESNALRVRFDQLDQSHPWKVGDDLAKVELTAADLDRYLRVRRGIEPGLRELVRQRQRMQSEFRSAGTGGIFNPYPVTSSWMVAEAAFLRTLVEELERETMGPHELDNLIALVEWRFLRRPEALVFGLPDYDRPDWVQTRQYLEESVAADMDPEYAKWLSRSKAKVASLEQRAAAAVDLSDATRSLLESRRAELEPLDSGVLPHLAMVYDPSLFMEDVEY